MIDHKPLDISTFLNKIKKDFDIEIYMTNNLEDAGFGLIYSLLTSVQTLEKQVQVLEETVANLSLHSNSGLP